MDIRVGRIRSIVLLVLFSLITLDVYYFYWFYGLNRELKLFLEGRGNPVGRLLIFLLVPVIGWFLATWWTGRSILRVQSRSGDPRPLVPVYAALWAALAPIVGWYIAAGILQGAANSAWARVADGIETGRWETLKVECPECSTEFGVQRIPVLTVPFECPNCHLGGVA